MATNKEIFLSILKNEKPLGMTGAFAAFPDGAAVFGPGGAERLFHAIIDPISNWDILQFSGERYLDNWGVTHRYILGVDPGIVPLTDDSNKVIKDITKWRDYVKFPEIPKDLDWSACRNHVKEMQDAGYLTMIPSFRGLFERLHSLETFEDVLIDMYEEPEAVNEFFEAYTDWKLEVFTQILDNVPNVDMIHSHDDLGSLQSMFFSPDKFRELLKPHYKRLYDFVHSRGVLVQHHCDCYVEPIVLDFAEMGVDMWQGALPTNDIVKLQKQLDEKGYNLMMLGGIDQTLVDREDVTDEAIRGEIHRAIDTYAPGGHFMPCIGSITCLHDHATEVCEDEMVKYGTEWYAKNYK
ncbi:MAG: uroporphyrinogen decarboxylase (URO-D) [Oscillospiraceae bacterium]|jgi:hypothetical protein|nr:uroporphyrinogen decarboxylase (URO-D) [Oscillospiraceae bacterium]